MHPSANLIISILDISINIRIRILDLSMNINIRKLVILMKPFCGNSNTPFHMKDQIFCIIRTTKDIGIMLWLNGGQGRLSQSLSLSL